MARFGQISYSDNDAEKCPPTLCWWLNECCWNIFPWHILNLEVKFWASLVMRISPIDGNLYVLLLPTQLSWWPELGFYSIGSMCLPQTGTIWSNLWPGATVNYLDRVVGLVSADNVIKVTAWLGSILSKPVNTKALNSINSFLQLMDWVVISYSDWSRYASVELISDSNLKAARLWRCLGFTAVVKR